MDSPLETLPLAIDESKNHFVDKDYDEHGCTFPSVPDGLNNLGSQPPPSYEFTIEQTASPLAPTLPDRTFRPPPLNQLKFEDASRVLDYADYYWEKLNWPKAQTHYTTAAVICRIVEDFRNEAFCLQRLGEIYRILRQFHAARAHILQAHIIFGQCGETARQLMCERWLARTASDEGNLEEGRLLLHSALDSSRSAGLRESEGWCLLRLGEIEGVDKSLIQQALDIAREEKLPLLENRCLTASSAHRKKSTNSQLQPSARKDTSGRNIKATSEEKAHKTITSTSKQGGIAPPDSKQKGATPGPSQADSGFRRWFKRFIS